jgi:hypothetical protein
MCGEPLPMVAAVGSGVDRLQLRLRSAILTLMATDWKALAQARQLNIPDLDRITAPLDGLEAAFRPLVRTIPHDVEPAIIFHAAEDAE